LKDIDPPTEDQVRFAQKMLTAHWESPNHT
jgi:hypothetical protein